MMETVFILLLNVFFMFCYLIIASCVFDLIVVIFKSKCNE